LICDSTVEENILKKAHQKKMLGDIAIEGGGFTTDFFQQVRHNIYMSVYAREGFSTSKI